MYANIDGLIARKLEITNYLKDKKPESVCLAETQLCGDIQINIIIIYGGRIEMTKEEIV